MKTQTVKKLIEAALESSGSIISQEHQQDYARLVEAMLMNGELAAKKVSELMHDPDPQTRLLACSIAMSAAANLGKR